VALGVTSQVTLARSKPLAVHTRGRLSGELKPVRSLLFEQRMSRISNSPRPVVPPRTSTTASTSASSAASSTLRADPAHVERFARSAWEGFGRAADRLGGVVRDAGARISDAGRALEAHGVPGGAEVRAIGERTSTAGTTIANAPERASAAASDTRHEVEGLARDARAAGERLVSQAGPAAERGMRVLHDGASRLEEGAREFARGVTGEAGRITDVGTMRPGDTVRMHAGGEGGVEGGRLRASSDIDISRDRDGFTVGMGGHLEGGLYGELGGAGSTSGAGTTGGAGSTSGSAPRAAAEVEGEAMVGGGGRTEFHFDSAAEVERASRILGHAAATSAGGTHHSTMSADDARFLREHVSALELHGTAAASLEGELGQGDGRARLGLAGSTGLTDRATARIEFPRDGSSPTLVLRDTVSASLSGSVDATIGHGTEASATLAGVNESAEIEVVDRFTLPHLDAGRLASDPGGTLRDASREMRRSTTQDVTMRLSGDGSARGVGELRAGTELNFHVPTGSVVESDAARRALSGDFTGAARALGPDTTVTARLTSGGSVGGPLGVGSDTTVTATTNAAALADSGAIDLARSGDLRGATRALGDSSRVSAETVTWREAGVRFNPDFEVMGFGGGVDISASRREELSRTSTREMSGSELADLLANSGRTAAGTTGAPLRG
jgi:hypothetical protein